MTAPAQSEKEDLVVALPDLPLVLTQLEHHKTDPAVHPTEQVEDKALGLVLLRKLDGLRARAERIRTEHRDEIAKLETLERRFTDLDALLFDLRKHFAGTFRGWIPTMGKNREVDGVLPSPGGGGGKVTVAGSVKDAEPVDPEDVEAPPSGTEGSGVLIGVLDTPLYPHQRLIGHVADKDLISALFDLVEKHALGLDGLLVWQAWQGHATFVADRIVHEAPGAMLDMRGVLDGVFGGATAWETAKEIVRFAGSGVSILNLSLGCITADGKQPLVLSRAVERLGSGVLVVAAAGNHGKEDQASAPIWPAALPNVVAVGATDADFSPKLPWVVCTAQGEDVVGAFLSETVMFPAADGEPTGVQSKIFRGYARWSGTSFAAATVSGAIAARMTSGKTAAEALDELLNQPGGVVKKFEFGP